MKEEENKMKKYKSQKKTQKLKRSIIYIILIFGAIIMFMPFLWMIRSALMTDAQIFTIPPEWIPRPFRWENYSEAFSYAPFLRYFINTIIIVVLVVIGNVVSCSITAYSFSRLEWKGRDLVFALVMSTMMMPYAVTLIPTFAGWSFLGAVNTFIPLTLPAWLGANGMFVFLLRQFFLGIPRELDEASYLDGASPLVVLFKVILPLSKPALIVVALFSFVATWNDFLGPLIYLADENRYTLALGLESFQSAYGSQWGYIMAISSVIILPSIILFFTLQKYFIQGVALTGGKN